MDLNDAVVTCAVSLEWNSAAGSTGRKLALRTATLRLLRNEAREIFVEISNDKSKPVKLKLKNVEVHKKFMSEGKASINFIAEKCILFISNAPPGPLMVFLRTLIVKMSGNENQDEAMVQKNLRAHLLSGKPSKFAEVSPVTNAEIILTRKALGFKGSATTPSPPHTKKRKLEEIRMNGGPEKLPSAKRLYQPSGFAEENQKLSEEQNRVLQACLSGKSIFFTGSAGTGKSFLLRKILSVLPPDGTVATASTGVAACLIGGVTIHSFAGIGGGDAGLSRCLDMASRPVNAQNWRRCKRLIIDEISMLDGEYFDKIEAVARHVRKTEKPFGGIQLIICGDFFQLPPVVRREGYSSTPNEKRFSFQSEAWEKCIQIVFELKEVHRQTDPEFVKILNHIRIGHVTEEMSNRLLATSRQKIESNGILATQLCSQNNDAHAINQTKLDNLTGEHREFKAEDSDPSFTKQLDAQVQAPANLILKVGAQVMLLKNINVAAGLVNGARGIVCKFDNGLPVVRFKNSLEHLCKPEKWIIKTPTGGLIVRKQVPLKLAWAFSIHKSQGLTLDCVEMSLSKVFEAGQAYVALSRAKSLDSIRILDFENKQVWANPQVLQYYKNFRRQLYDLPMIPLGVKTKGQKDKIKAFSKIKKSLMDKPLVNIS